MDNNERCPITGNECLKAECSLCLNDSKNVHNSCQLQKWLDLFPHRQSAFNARINELYAEAGGYD